MLFYYESENNTRPTGVLMLEGSYCERLSKAPMERNASVSLIDVLWEQHTSDRRALLRAIQQGACRGYASVSELKGTRYGKTTFFLKCWRQYLRHSKKKMIIKLCWNYAKCTTWLIWTTDGIAIVHQFVCGKSPRAVYKWVLCEPKHVLTSVPNDYIRLACWSNG